MTRDELLDQLAVRFVAVPQNRPYRVAVNGPVAVGKSHFTGDLVERVEALGRPARTVSVDAFLLPRAVRNEAVERGFPAAVRLYDHVLDFELLRDRVLRPLGPNGDLRFIRGTVDRETGEPLTGAPELCPTNAIFIVDGVLLLRSVVRDHWDCRIYLDAPLDVAMQRAVRRNHTYRQFADDDAVRTHYRSLFAPLHRHYEARANPQEHADILIDYTDLQNLEAR